MDSVEQEFDEDFRKRVNIDDGKYKTRKQQKFENSDSEDSCDDDKGTSATHNKTEIKVGYNQTQETSEFGKPNPTLSKHYCMFFSNLLKIE